MIQVIQIWLHTVSLVVPGHHVYRIAGTRRSRVLLHDEVSLSHVSWEAASWVSLPAVPLRYGRTFMGFILTQSQDCEKGTPVPQGIKVF